MLKNQKIKIFRRKNSELQNTSSKVMRDIIIQTKIKIGYRTGCTASNNTEIIVKLARKAGMGGGGSTSAFG